MIGGPLSTFGRGMSLAELLQQPGPALTAKEHTDVETTSDDWMERRRLSYRIGELIDEFGYSRVKYELEFQRPKGRPSRPEGFSIFIYEMVELVKAGANLSNEAAAYKFIVSLGGIPFPDFPQGEYRRQAIATVSSLKREYMRGAKASRRQHSGETDSGFVKNRLEAWQQSGLSFRRWMKRWLDSLYVSPPR